MISLSRFIHDHKVMMEINADPQVACSCLHHWKLAFPSKFDLIRILNLFPVQISIEVL